MPPETFTRPAIASSELERQVVGLSLVLRSTRPSGASRAPCEGARARATASRETCSFVKCPTGEVSRSLHGDGRDGQARFQGPRRPGPVRATGGGTCSWPDHDEKRCVSAPASVASRQPNGRAEGHLPAAIEVAERRSEAEEGRRGALMARTTQPSRSEGPPTGCASGRGRAAAVHFGAVRRLPWPRPTSTAERGGQHPTPAKRRNDAGRLFGPGPGLGTPHARFSGTGSWRRIMPEHRASGAGDTSVGR